MFSATATKSGSDSQRPPSLKVLSDCEGQLQHLTRERHQRAEAQYRLGVEALQQAQASGFADRQALQQATQNLLEALQKNRRNPQPYLMMTYLLMLLGDYPRARRYLREALRLEPGHPTALQLQAGLEEVQQQNVSPADLQAQAERASAYRARQPQLGSQAPLEPLDPEALYEQTEQALSTQLRSWLQARHNPLPTLDTAELAAIITQQEQLDKQLTNFRQQLTLLEADTDTQPLYKLLQPLEALQRRYRRAGELSASFAGFLADTAAATAQAQHLLAALNDASAGGPALEQLLDVCDALADRLDALADRLDALADQKVDILPIKPPYKHLLALVGHIQDTWDDKAA